MPSRKKTNRVPAPKSGARPPGEPTQPRPAALSRSLNLKRLKLGGAVGVAALITMAGLYFGAWRPADDRAGPAIPATAATFTGSAACATCHADAYALWKRSHHALSMQEASETSVLGDFGGVQFTHGDVTSTFARRDGRFIVNTDGPDGRVAEFEVKYAFGFEPLQQYLIEQEGGRLQALSMAWDARPRRADGQRWFHLYPDERVAHEDELHWTGRRQNWNYMCADCHSTNLRKNYDAANDRYDTTWAEINVACEACHGPGSNHIAWAERAKHGSRGGDESKGLTVMLRERRDVTWQIDPASGSASRSHPRTSDTEIGICAQCHSRRSQIADGYVAGAPFLDHYLPTLVTAGLYHPDGQQRDEVYNYGSFLQSKMHQRGVTCGDCHEPHGQKLRAPGNAVCGQCHLPDKFDAASHHLHPAGSAGAACAACHLPTTRYMGVDPRHDHAIRVPRPDLSSTLGVPNACNGCHVDQTAQWAADRLRDHFGRTPTRGPPFAAAFHAAEASAPRAGAGLVAIAGDPSQSAIVRASAFVRLGEWLTPRSLEAARGALEDGDPLVRYAALGVLTGVAPQDRLVAVKLLGDPVRAVRIEAARVLAPASIQSLGGKDQAAFARAAAEYIAAQKLNADLPEYRVNLGSFLAERGQIAEAEAEFRAALRLDRRHAPAYVNLADLHRRQGREAEAERWLRDGLTVSPRDASLHHALGLSLARARRIAEAVAALEQAANLAPANARFAYVHAVALHSTGQPTRAIAVLENVIATRPSDRDALLALATFYRDAGDAAAALRYAELFAEAHPDDPEAADLVRSMRALRRP